MQGAGSKLRAICFNVAIAWFCSLSSLAWAEEYLSNRLFASGALALREAAIRGEDSALDILSEIPGATVGWRELPLLLWKPFFENSIVKFGRLDSPAPVALYYNPLIDVALITAWRQDGGVYDVVRARTLPGERLSDADAPVELYPNWMSADEAPVLHMLRNAAERLDSFGSFHPINGDVAGRFAGTYANAAANGRLAVARLAWNAAQWRARLVDGTPTWLVPTLSEVEEALAAQNAARLLEAAPQTDEETAAALAQLPSEYIDRLGLDMVLREAGGDFLLVASAPEDGDIFVLAKCRPVADICNLRKFVLQSVHD